jgi:hypothetical protein
MTDFIIKFMVSKYAIISMNEAEKTRYKLITSRDMEKFIGLIIFM